MKMKVAFLKHWFVSASRLLEMSEMIKSSHDAVVGRKRPEAVDILELS